MIRENRNIKSSGIAAAFYVACGADLEKGIEKILRADPQINRDCPLKRKHGEMGSPVPSFGIVHYRLKIEPVSRDFVPLTQNICAVGRTQMPEAACLCSDSGKGRMIKKSPGVARGIIFPYYNVSTNAPRRSKSVRTAFHPPGMERSFSWSCHSKSCFPAGRKIRMVGPAPDRQAP